MTNPHGNLQLVLDSLKDPIIVVDIGNKNVTSNSAARKIEHFVDSCVLQPEHCSNINCVFYSLGAEDSCLVKNSISMTNYSSGFFRLRRDNGNFTTYLHSTTTPHSGYIVLHMKQGDNGNGQSGLPSSESILERSHYDMLTGLPNVGYLQDTLQQEIIRAQRHRKMLSVMFIDICRFNLVNNAYGREQGDVVLRNIAQRIRNTLRASDVLIRQGGDVFIAIVTDIEAIQDVGIVAKKIRGAVSMPISINNQKIILESCIGASLYPDNGVTPETLIKNADIALQSAKTSQKKDLFFYANSMDNDLEKRLAFENSLLTALERNEFTLYYQPQIHASTGQMVNAEALIRWKSPRFGLVKPSEFIPLAERMGIITDIGAWVIRTACEHLSRWMSMGFPPIVISVNISIKQFRDPDFIVVIKNALEESCVPPEFLCLEVTENVIMENAEAVVETMNRIHDMGVKLAIDDFGTGYSSLYYLKKLPVDKLKIDRSFIRNITSDEADAAIVKTVINLAHNFKLKVTAEGVESSEHVDFLNTLECDELQGYFISRPLSHDDFSMLWIGALVLQEKLVGPSSINWRHAEAESPSP